jgi:hypothetical protein
MSRTHFWLVAVALGFFAANVQAAPLSVRVEDHDFSFDVPYWGAAPWGAVYDFNGLSPDALYVQSSNPNHYVGSYSYVGKAPTVPGGPLPSAFPYPVANSTTFGGDLKLDMTFNLNDGPYTSPSGDRFDISLVGDGGRLTITGQIYNQGLGPASMPLYPPPGIQPQDIVLLDIAFDKVTLLARVNENRIFKVEGRGALNTLLGEDVTGMDLLGVAMFDFIAEAPAAAIFTNPNYSPTDDVYGQIWGDINGHTGVPEPATLGLLALGGLAVARARRRK